MRVTLLAVLVLPCPCALAKETGYLLDNRIKRWPYARAVCPPGMQVTSFTDCRDIAESLSLPFSVDATPVATAPRGCVMNIAATPPDGGMALAPGAFTWNDPVDTTDKTEECEGATACLCYDTCKASQRCGPHAKCIKNRQDVWQCVSTCNDHTDTPDTYGCKGIAAPIGPVDTDDWGDAQYATCWAAFTTIDRCPINKPFRCLGPEVCGDEQDQCCSSDWKCQLLDTSGGDELNGLGPDTSGCPLTAAPVTGAPVTHAPATTAPVSGAPATRPPRRLRCNELGWEQCRDPTRKDCAWAKKKKGADETCVNKCNKWDGKRKKCELKFWCKWIKKTDKCKKD